MPASPQSHPLRKYLRISIRGLIVLVLVIGTWLGWVTRSARIEREAVAAIYNDRGMALYDWELSQGKYSPSGRPWAPLWLVDLVGLEYFGHVHQVRFWGAWWLTEDVIVHVGRLAQLQKLDMTDASVGDVGLAHLSGLTRLSSLDLRFTLVTDAGLVHLKRMTSLESLDLSRNRITDAGLAHLKALRKLTTLKLGYTQVTDAGLVHLEGMTNLVDLDLESTPISDAGLARLKGLPRLRCLRLSHTHVTEAGMNELKQALPGLIIDFFPDFPVPRRKSSVSHL